MTKPRSKAPAADPRPAPDLPPPPAEGGSYVLMNGAWVRETETPAAAAAQED